MTRAEDTALLNVVRSGTVFEPDGSVYVGKAETPDHKPITGRWYLVMQPGPNTDSQERATAAYAVRRPQWTFQCVGTTPEQAQWVSEHLDAVLRPSQLGVALLVNGERNDRIRRDYVSSVQDDTDVTPALWYQTVEYSFRSQTL